MNILLLIIFSALMWLFHRFCITQLAKKVSSTKSDAFRIGDAFLMGFSLIAMVTIYGRVREAIIGFMLAVAIIAGTTLALDLLDKFVTKKSNLDLDIGHYLTGYAVIVAVLIAL